MTAIKYSTCWFVLVFVWAAMVGMKGATNATDILTCTANATITFTPGLLLVERPQLVAYAIDYTNCVSNSRPDIVSGRHSGVFADPARGCLSLGAHADETVSVEWNTGETTVATTTASGTDIGGQTIHLQLGQVTQGLFLGALFQETLVQVNPNLLQCLFAPGVREQTAVGTLLITGV